MRLILSALAVCAFGATANAAVLWDQGNVDAAVNAIVNQEFVNYPDYSSYMANDFEADAAWNITKVTIYLTNNNGTWGGIPDAQARFNLWNTYPDTDPGAGDLVPATYTQTADGLAMSVDVDVNVDAGMFWLGLTPHVDFTVYGQEFCQAAPIWGENTAWRNPGGAFGYGTDWTNAYILDTTGVWQDNYDMAMLIEGTVVPGPGALALLGLAGLARRRRR